MVYGVCMLYRIWCIEPVEPPWLARGGFDRTSRTPPGYGHEPYKTSTRFGYKPVQVDLPIINLDLGNIENHILVFLQALINHLAVRIIQNHFYFKKPLL